MNVIRGVILQTWPIKTVVLQLEGVEELKAFALDELEVEGIRAGGVSMKLKSMADFVQEGMKKQ